MATITVYKDGKSYTTSDQYLQGFLNSGWSTKQSPTATPTTNNQVLTQGTPYYDTETGQNLGTVQYDVNTGQRLASGATTQPLSSSSLRSSSTPSTPTPSPTTRSSSYSSSGVPISTSRTSSNSTVSSAPISSGGRSPLELTQALQTKPVFSLLGGMLKQGMYDNQNVAQLQKLLGVTEDGDFGPMTKQAVVNFQKNAGITADGIVGPQTVAALNARYGTTEAPTESVVGTSAAARAETRAEGIARMKAELEEGLKAPDVFSSVKEFDRLRKEQGIVKDEEELAAIRNESMMAQQELREFAYTVGKEMPEGGRLGAIGEAERNARFRLESLAIREQAVLNRVNAKNSYINTMMGLKKDDYQTAYTNYTNEYNKNLKAIQMYNEELDDQQQDALTAFTTMTNLLSKSGMNEITPELSTQLDSLALQAGLPTGVFQTALKGISFNEQLKNVQMVGDDVYMWTQGADGQPHLKLIKSAPTEGVTPGSGINSEYAGIIDTILGSGKFTKDQAAAMTNAINNGEDPFTVVKNQAKNLLGQTGDTKLTNYEVAKEQMLAVEQSLKDYYANGGKTSLLTGTYESVINKLGEVSDPKLVSIATEIASALQIYRNAVSGTAYSVQEGIDIAKIFPGINKSEGLNQAILEGRMKAFDSTIDATYRSVLGSEYDKLKALNTAPETPSFDSPEWMNDYNYDRDIKWAQEIIAEDPTQKEAVRQILLQKYLQVDL